MSSSAPVASRNLRKLSARVSTEWIPRYPRRAVAYLELNGWKQTWVERETELQAIDELLELLPDYGLTADEIATVRAARAAIANSGCGFPKGAQL